MTDMWCLRELYRVQVSNPGRRSDAVKALRGKFGVSERRACEVVGQSRSSERRLVAEDLPEGPLQTVADELPAARQSA